MAPDTLDGRKRGALQVAHLDLGVLGREVLVGAARHEQDGGLDAAQGGPVHVVVGDGAAERRGGHLLARHDAADVAHLPHAAEHEQVLGVPVEEAGLARLDNELLDPLEAEPAVRVPPFPVLLATRAPFAPPPLPEPGRARQPRVVRAPKDPQPALRPQLLPVALELALAAHLGVLHLPPRDVVDRVRQRADRALEKGVVVRARARAAADGDDVRHERREHDGPVVGLLGAHAEADDGGELRDAEVGGQELVLRPHAVFVVQLAGDGEEGLVGGGGRLAVAEHRDDDDVVVAQAVMGRRGEGEGRVDAAAVAGRDQDDAFGGGGVDGLVGDFDVVERRPGREGEAGDHVVFDPGGIVRGGRGHDGQSGKLRWCA